MNRIKYILIALCFLQINTSYSQKKGKNKKADKNQEQMVISEAILLKAERLFFDGQKAKLTGDLDEAYEQFSSAVKIHPNLDAAFYELAQLQQLADDYSGAQKNMEKALELSPKNMWYQIFLGDLLAAQFEYEQAARIYHALRTDNTQEYDFYFQEAYYLILTDQLKQAIGVYDEIEAAIGVQADASLQKHKIYARLKKHEEAEATLLKLIDTFPDDLEFRNELADYYLINGNTENAVETFEGILKINPNDVYALTSLADYYKTIGDSKRAIEYSERAFANPDIPIDAKISVLYNYIQYYDQRKEQIIEAFDLADILIRTHPKEAKGYAIAGDLRNLDNSPEEALPYYYRALEHQQDIFTVWQQIFFINSDLQNFDTLIKYTDLAKEFFPNQGLVYFFNGLGHQQKNNYVQAERAYSRGVKMAGDNLELKAQLYANMGDVYNELNNFEESDRHFEKALNINPRNAYVLNNYSYYLSLRGENLKRAQELSFLANEIEPNNSSFLDTYAWVLYKSEKYKDAKEWQMKAIEASENPSATLMEHLGDILFMLGDEKNALEKWKKALELSDSNEKLVNKIADKTLYE